METNNINYSQIVNQTFEEKVRMYMKTCTKKELAKMLAMRDIIDLQKADKSFEPYDANKSVLPYWYNKCKSWSDCKNPQMDCINCPLRGGLPINEKWNITCSNTLDAKIDDKWK